jgi:hypothetical protein
MSRRNNPWTEAQIAELRARYPDTQTALLAREWGRTINSVYSMADKLKLKKTVDYLATEHGGRLRALNLTGPRFEIGHKPWNIGMKGLMLAGEKGRQYWFKKGTLNGAAAVNERPLGSLRVGKGDLLEIKISLAHGEKKSARWRPYHAQLWIAAHGPIPPGHIIIFSDGNRRNFDLGNLLCITRQENMQRNSLHNKWPKEFCIVAQLRGALNRRIREMERNNESKHD